MRKTRKRRRKLRDQGGDDADKTPTTSQPPSVEEMKADGRALRLQVENAALRQLKKLLNKGELDAAQLCAVVKAYCELKKQDVAETKAKAAAKPARRKGQSAWPDDDDDDFDDGLTLKQRREAIRDATVEYAREIYGIRIPPNWCETTPPMPSAAPSSAPSPTSSSAPSSTARPAANPAAKPAATTAIEPTPRSAPARSSPGG